MKNRSDQAYGIIYLSLFIAYILYSTLSLTGYPFVHSDETWLAGLSKTIWDSGSFKVTEPFFHLFPRQPHAIKSLFHLTQGLWTSGFGYSIQSVRALSLFISAIYLGMFYWYASRKSEDGSRVRAFLLTALQAVSIQFIYASHFARQEIFILLFMMISYAYVDFRILSHPGKITLRPGIILGFVTGVSIGFHPNSFLIGCVILSILVYDAWKQRRWSALVPYSVTSGLFAALAVAVSLYWNTSFVHDYRDFGQSLGATGGIVEKITSFPLFLYKLYHQISGTYHTPDIRFEMVLLVLLLLLSTAVAAWRRLNKIETLPELEVPIAGALGLTAGLILIGRYNATSIVFYLPFISFLAMGLMKQSRKSTVPSTAPLLILAVTVGLLGVKGFQIVSQPVLEPYADYLMEIRKAVPDGQQTLVNLNAGFAFDPQNFSDYRDLAYLEDAGMTMLEYLDRYDIDFVVLPEEMDYIYRNQDKWSILYGEMPYYPELLSILENQFEIVHDFQSPQYGMRIPVYNDGYPWTVRVFKRRRD